MTEDEASEDAHMVYIYFRKLRDEGVQLGIAERLAASYATSLVFYRKPTPEEGGRQPWEL
jgi:hypothetical protein